jgi:hypothetical protein
MVVHCSFIKNVMPRSLLRYNDIHTIVVYDILISPPRIGKPRIIVL